MPTVPTYLELNGSACFTETEDQCVQFGMKSSSDDTVTAIDGM